MRVQALAEEQHLRLVGPEPNALNGGWALWYATAPASVVPPPPCPVSQTQARSRAHHEVVAERARRACSPRSADRASGRSRSPGAPPPPPPPPRARTAHPPGPHPASDPSAARGPAPCSPALQPARAGAPSRHAAGTPPPPPRPPRQEHRE